MAMNEIGSVQQPKKLARLWNFSYDKRLSILWLERLELLCFKIVKNVLDNGHSIQYFYIFLNIRTMHCHQLILVLPYSGISVRSIQFAVHVVQYQNSLLSVSSRLIIHIHLNVQNIDFSFTLIGRA